MTLRGERIDGKQYQYLRAIQGPRIAKNAHLFTLESIHEKLVVIFISRGAEGPGREILQRPPSVCLSVRLSVRHV